MVDYIQQKFREIRGKRFSSSSGIERCIRKNPSSRSPSGTSLEVMLPQLSLNDAILSVNDFREITESNDQIYLNNKASILKKVINSHPIVLRGSNSLDTLFTGSPFVIEALYWHNAFRKRHNSPSLTLSSELCEKAQEWANSLTHKDVFYHKNDEEIGENLLLKCSNLTNLDINGEEVTKLWYSEIDKYAFHLSPCLLHTQANRFTQLVWKETKEFGIGKAKTREGKLIVVANYRPAGNVVGEYHSNVLPICEDEEEDEDSDSTCSDRPIHFECSE